MNTFHRIDINIVAIVMLLYVILISRKRLDFKQRINKIFFLTCIGVSLQLAIETISCLINGIEGNVVLFFANLLHVMLFAFAPIISFIWFLLLKTIVFPYNIFKGKTNILFGVPVAINFVLAVVSPFTGYIFTIGPGNIYERGPLFALAAVFTYVYLAMAFLIIVFNRKYIIKNELTFFLVATSLPIIGGVFQSLFYGVLLMWSMAGFALIVGYIFLQQRMVQIDGLTGCWSRESFMYSLERKITMRPDSKFAAIYVDIDDLKGINDKYGHFEGDEAIKAIVAVIKDCIGNQGIIARMGGDEFVVLLDTGEIDKANETIETIKSKFAKINNNTTKEYRLKCSFGAEIYDKKYQGINEFLSHVDTLMYKQKHKQSQ